MPDCVFVETETDLVMGWYSATLLAMAAGALAQADVDSGRSRLPENPFVLDPHRACACYCIKFLDATFGGQTEYHDIARRCSPGPRGVSFDRVRDVAAELGYYASPVKATMSQLRRISTPAIIHLNKTNGPDHYVVWLGWNDQLNKAYIFSPPVSLGYQDPDDIGDYSGNAMLVSDDPIPEPVIVSNRHSTGFATLINVVTVIISLMTCVLIFRSGGKVQSSAGHGVPSAVILLCSCIVGCSGSVHDSGSVPEVTPRRVDLGEINEDTDLEYTFVVKNTTDVPFQILNVEKSCNCQAVGIEVGQTVNSQETFSVPYQVPNDGTPGPHTGRLLITTSSQDESLRVITLALQGRVQKACRAIPAHIVFGVVSDEKKVTGRQVRLESELPGFIERFDRAESRHGLVSASVASTSPGTIVFDVSLAEDIPYGEITDSISFSFRGNSAVPVVVDVRAKKIGAVQIMPSRLTWNTTARSRQRVRLKSVSGEPFRVTKVDLPSYCSVDLPSTEPSAVHDITIEFSSVQSDSVAAECTFYTDVFDRPVSLPVRIN